MFISTLVHRNLGFIAIIRIKAHKYIYTDSFQHCSGLMGLIGTILENYYSEASTTIE